MALPTETFDPSPEEIDRYAAQLSRSRRTLRSVLSRPAQGVRLRLDSVGDGQAVYRIEGLGDAASILRLSGYREVEMRPADSIDEEALRSLVDVPAGDDSDVAETAVLAVSPAGEGEDDAEVLEGRRPGAGQEGRSR